MKKRAKKKRCRTELRDFGLVKTQETLELKCPVIYWRLIAYGRSGKGLILRNQTRPSFLEDPTPIIFVPVSKQSNVKNNAKNR